MPRSHCPRRVRLITVLGLAVTLTSTAVSSTAAPTRPLSAHRAPHPAAGGITVTPTIDAQQLLQCLLGPGVVATNVVLSAADSASGLFDGGLAIVGIGSGVVLGTGSVRGLIGPNTYDDFTLDNARPGDPDLDALIPGYQTYDATVLEFDFECPNPQVVSFQYVFASEEYNEYVNSPFNDVFGFFLNGANIAIAPSGCSDPGRPVSINNVNSGNPFVAAGGPNWNCYRNNARPDGGPFFDTEMDGLTQVFYATGTLVAGTNHIKLAVADAGDHVLDSNVMIACQTFTCDAAPPTGACCFPNGTCVTLSYPQCYGQGGAFHGAGVACDPEPCAEPVGACCFPDGSCEVEGPNGCALNGGIYRGDGTLCLPDACATGVADSPRDPARLVATPNPSAGAVRIAYRLGTSSQVTVEILDGTGRLVRRLADGRRPAGDHGLTWDGLDGSGRRPAAGVYFVLLKTREGVAMRKLALAR